MKKARAGLRDHFLNSLHQLTRTIRAGGDFGEALGTGAEDLAVGRDYDSDEDVIGQDLAMGRDYESDEDVIGQFSESDTTEDHSSVSSTDEEDS